MSWQPHLQSEILDEFVGARHWARRGSRVAAGLEDGVALAVVFRHRPVRELTALEAAFLSELRSDSRVARAASALKLGSRVARRMAVALCRQRWIHLERLKNKRGTLVARFDRDSLFE